jgi:PAS domain S-box-containing protein
MSRLLIVSSSDLEPALGRTVLWRPGVRRVYTAEPEAAVEAARSLRPTVVLTDSAQHSSTVSLIRRLREDPETRSTAFVVLTSPSSAGAEADLRKAGVNAIISSPVDPFVWDTRLERLLNVPRRREALIPVLLEVWSRLEPTTPFLQGLALNIGVRGTLLQTEEPLLTGAKLDLRFTLPEDTVELQVLGQVVRQAGIIEGRHGSGIEFLVLQRDARERISLFVESSLWPRPAATPSETVTQHLVERGEWESELRASDARKAAIVEAAPDGIITADPEGRILEFNPAAERILGYARAEVLGKNIEATIVPPSLLERYRRAHALCLATGEDQQPGRHVETTGVRADGSSFPMELAVTPIQLRGQRLLTVFLRDISQRKQEEEKRRQLEAQVQHAQKLESLGVLAGGVAHDFNNLLVGMLGHSSLALTKLPPGSPARGNLEGVVESAERAADLARQMLAYSGRGQFVVRVVDLNAIVRENLHLLEAIVSKKVRLRAVLSEDPPLVKADVGQLQQVVMNLAVNGAEAVGDGVGTVKITTGFETLSGDKSKYSRFTASELEPGRYVYLEVRDDGAGMEAETVSTIFDPFFTTKFVGRGLGLSAVLGIIRGHGGGIDVRSEPGQGTSFRLVFPATQEAPATAETERTGARVEGTVLLIDDEQVVREAASEILEGQGLKVLTAESGAAGVALFRERGAGIGLVLLDYSMPEMDGHETLEALREIDPDVNVVLTSGYGQEEATRRFEGSGLKGFIQKPYTPEAMRAEIRRCLPGG